jgi:hypothetical protein
MLDQVLNGDSLIFRIRKCVGTPGRDRRISSQDRALNSGGRPQNPGDWPETITASAPKSAATFLSFYTLLRQAKTRRRVLKQDQSV